VCGRWQALAQRPPAQRTSFRGMPAVRTPADRHI